MTCHETGFAPKKCKVRRRLYSLPVRLFGRGITPNSKAERFGTGSTAAGQAKVALQFRPPPVPEFGFHRVCISTPLLMPPVSRSEFRLHPVELQGIFHGMKAELQTRTGSRPDSIRVGRNAGKAHGHFNSPSICFAASASFPDSFKASACCKFTLLSVRFLSWNWALPK